MHHPKTKLPKIEEIASLESFQEDAQPMNIA
jgi:hypothetical protein